MIIINRTENHTILSYFNSGIVLLNEVYDTLNNNLFVNYGKDKRVKISIEELTFGDFNLLWHKHIPNYNDEQQRTLDVLYVMSKCEWSSTKILNQ